MNKGPENRTKAGLWLSTAVSIIGLLVVVLFAWMIENSLNLDFNPTLLTVISLLIAFVPPLIWLTVFYRQDRLQPEPKSLVFKTLILGALLQKAFYMPLMAAIMPETQKGTSFVSDYIFTVLLVALIQEASKLLTVRYSVYPTREFDEKIDGIVYGSALGLGFAAMTNLDLILGSGGTVLTAVSSTVVIESFAHASITGLSCYIMGLAKFEKFSFWRMPAAVVLATALNASSRFIIDNLMRTGFKVNYIIGIVPAAILAILVFGVLVIITNKRVASNVQKDEIREVDSKRFLAALPVWILLVVALSTGFIIKHLPEKTVQVSVTDSVSLSYPSKWIQITSEDYSFKAADMIHGDNQNFVSANTYKLEDLIKSEQQTPSLEDIGGAWSIRSARSYQYYASLKNYTLQFNGNDAWVIEYIYIANNTSAIVTSKNPNIGYAKDIIMKSGDGVCVVTISTAYEDWVVKKDNFDQINLSVKGQ